MVKTGEFYAGSRMLMPLSDLSGLPIDQVNFLLCQLVALALATPFRKYLSPKFTQPEIRHLVSALFGILLTVFCFGYQIWYLVVQSAVCYLIMKYVDKDIQHRLVFAVALIYLSVAHMYRQYYDYGGYTLDITGPLMIMTQKLSSMAFAVRDGQCPEEKLSEDQKSQAIRKFPSLLEFYSYMFYFHGIMVGPLSFYSDYISFVEGRNYAVAQKTEVTENGKSDPEAEEPTPGMIVLQKLVTALICGGLMMLQPTVFPAQHLTDADFLHDTNLLQKTTYLLVSITLIRSKYYFAWKLAEALNNAAGFGFNGYDKDGRERWDLVDNVDIAGLELSSSLKVNIGSWNKTTLVWLRRVVYDRMSSYNTLAVFTCSAVWHGFYPGYYLTFGTGALFTFAARYVRRNIRPYFIESTSMKLFYDIVTFCFTRIANVYLAASFVILQLVPSLRLYLSMYFWLHMLATAVIIYYAFLASKPKNKDQKQQ